MVCSVVVQDCFLASVLSRLKAPRLLFTMSNVFMLMSVPGDRNSSDAKAGKAQSFAKANSIASSYGSPCDKFEIPTLKVVNKRELLVFDSATVRNPDRL